MKNKITKSTEYYSFHHIKGRILNSKNAAYKDYGGRGLTIDPRYIGKKGFTNFLNDVGKKPYSNMSIERINNSKGYIKGNIKWATMREQTRNRRSNHLLTFKNQTKTITEWAEEMGAKPNTFMQRINEYGWSIKKTLTTPIQQTSKIFV